MSAQESFPDPFQYKPVELFSLQVETAALCADPVAATAENMRSLQREYGLDDTEVVEMTFPTIAGQHLKDVAREEPMRLDLTPPVLTVTGHCYFASVIRQGIEFFDEDDPLDKTHLDGIFGISGVTEIAGETHLVDGLVPVSAIQGLRRLVLDV